MSWLKEAQEKINIKNKQEINQTSCHFLDDEEILTKEIRSIYENATTREVEKAINLAKEHLGTDCLKKDFLNFIRIKLED